MGSPELDNRASSEKVHPGRSLRVCVIAHHSRAAGGLSVAQNMIAALGRVAPQHTYLVTIAPACGFEELCQQLPRCQTMVREPGGLLSEWLYETFRLPKVVAGLRPDVILALGNRGLLHPPSPQAVLVEDPHLSYPAGQYGDETVKRKVVLTYHKWCMRKQLKNTRLLLCQTAVAEQRLREKYNYTARTEICPNAMPALTLRGDDNPRLPEPLAGLAGKMKLFCLTSYYSHKNLKSILAAFREFGRELEEVAVITTVAADQDPNAPGFLRRTEQWGLSDRIINVGPIPQESLAGYYRHCQALLLPTLLESFSTTYVEAMHFGLPILTSDLDFAHVVCDDAAIYFDPWSPASMRDAILCLKNDPQLAAALAERGRKRLATFDSWEDIAPKVASWLEQLGCANQADDRRRSPR